MIIIISSGLETPHQATPIHHDLVSKPAGSHHPLQSGDLKDGPLSDTCQSLVG